MKYKAIIFDLDGTLLDTIKDLALTVNAVLKRNSFREHPVEAYRYFVGDGIEKLVQRAFPAESIAGRKELTVFVNAVIEEYSRRWSDHTVPYPGVPGLLNYLERRQIPKAIFTNKPHQFALLTVEKLLPEWSFAEVCGITDGMPRKPDPFGAMQIAETLRLNPREIIYLGDTDTDMRTAIAGGFYPVGALWGFRQKEELLAGGAQKLADSPADVIELFE